PTAYFTTKAPGPTPRVLVDPARVAELAAGISAAADVPAQEPRLESQGARITVRPGVPGRRIDRDAAIRGALHTLSAAASGNPFAPRIVALRHDVQAPQREGRALLPATDWANARLDVPLVIDYQGQRRTLPADRLARLLVAGTADPSIAEFDRAALLKMLAEWAPTWITLDARDAVTEPAVIIDGGQIIIRAGRPGAVLDLEILATNVATRFASLEPAERMVRVTTRTIAPQRSEADLQSLRDAAAAMIAEGATVYSFAGDWRLTAEDLLPALRLARVDGKDVPALDPTTLATRLGSIAKDAEARAATMRLRDASGAAWRVDPRATAEQLAKSLPEANRYVPLHWLNGGLPS
ncbi:MAG TPA: peptidoglycan binding domain-containing protein, partial [Chloroflexota bacterium]|nr:peptidoglycan binding domain-containing protein [Chloroflexota bacterium]